MTTMSIVDDQGEVIHIRITLLLDHEGVAHIMITLLSNRGRVTNVGFTLSLDGEKLLDKLSDCEDKVVLTLLLDGAVNLVFLGKSRR
ncbi:Uncharacterized protein TCM_004137 [Theobroma cacao]|uniref:Uncharacterized protein n=1 Tax=Theobroma cacao TaxID=3641 RepID=A0A061DWY6_THECC|nr:Uncharacterized protein TCM_004137 [Theobroma cacao]